MQAGRVRIVWQALQHYFLCAAASDHVPAARNSRHVVHTELPLASMQLPPLAAYIPDYPLQASNNLQNDQNRSHVRAGRRRPAETACP